MRNYLILFLLILFSFNTTASTTNAAEPIKLYKNYKFGTDFRTIKKIKGAYDCSEDLGEDALCVEDQKFLGIDVVLGFNFYNKKLSQVSVIMSFNQPNNVKVFSALNKKFTLVQMKNMAGQTLDVVNLTNTKPKSQLQATVQQFEQIALASGEITYSYFETETIRPFFAKSRSILDLVKQAPMNVRGVDYRIFEGDEGDAFGFISFVAPKVMLAALSKEVKKQDEDF